MKNQEHKKIKKELGTTCKCKGCSRVGFLKTSNLSDCTLIPWVITLKTLIHTLKHVTYSKIMDSAFKKKKHYLCLFSEVLNICH